MSLTIADEYCDPSGSTLQNIRARKRRGCCQQFSFGAPMPLRLTASRLLKAVNYSTSLCITSIRSHIARRFVINLAGTSVSRSPRCFLPSWEKIRRRSQLLSASQTPLPKQGTHIGIVTAAQLLEYKESRRLPMESPQQTPAYSQLQLSYTVQDDFSL